MRGPTRIIRLDVVEPDEHILPTTPIPRSLDGVQTISPVAVAIVRANGDKYVRRPEIRLERHARMWRLLRIRPPRLDLRREYLMHVFDEAGQRPRAVQS